MNFSDALEHYLYLEKELGRLKHETCRDYDAKYSELEEAFEDLSKSEKEYLKQRGAWDR